MHATDPTDIPGPADAFGSTFSPTCGRQRRVLRVLTRAGTALGLALLASLAFSPPALATPAGTVADTPLPAEFEAALARARIPKDAVSVLLVEATGNTSTAARIAHRAEVAMNPASVMKLVTTFAALDLLGPAFTWSTPVYLDGPVKNGVLQGNLIVRGQGDPKLVLERMWLLLRKLQGMGIRSIQGDIVLDRTAFVVPDQDPGQFDGEPLRPYNASPDALLLNYKSVVMTFSPMAGSNQAAVQFDPPLAGVSMPVSVPLSSSATSDCVDYRAALKADFSDPNRIRFLGSYPAGCGERVWPVAYADPKSYAPRALLGLWQEMGGQLSGKVRYGTLAPHLLTTKPALELQSPPLFEIIRDINKFSNNVMAQQVFLTLGQTGTFAQSQAVLQRWWSERVGNAAPPVVENGSGLSRQERITANALAQMLQVAYRAPTMPELMSSLPVTGVDGTLRRMKSRTSGSAHLKTGSLSNVIARAGYVHTPSGKRYVLVAIVNHANANSEASRQAMDALVEAATRLP